MSATRAPVRTRGKIASEKCRADRSPWTQRSCASVEAERRRVARRTWQRHAFAGAIANLALLASYDDEIVKLLGAGVMKAVILAGGLGTRLAEETGTKRGRGCSTYDGWRDRRIS